MKPIWLASYPPSIPATIDVAAYPSLVHLLDDAFSNYRQRTAYKFMGKAISFRQVDEASAAVGAYLQGLGLAKGDRVEAGQVMAVVDLDAVKAAGYQIGRAHV